MTRRRRRFVVGLLVLGVLVAIAALAPVVVDFAAERALEGWASEAAGAEVRIDVADVSLLRPQLALAGVVVENPPGFEGGPALTVERLSVAVDLGSLASPALTVRELAADGFELRYSRAGDLGNLEAIESNVIAFLERRGLASEPRVVLEELRARRGQATAPVLVGRATVPLEDLAFRDIGGPDGGLPPPDLVAALFDLMEPSLTSALAHTDYGGLFGKARRGVAGAARKLKGLFR